jgi:flagellin
MLEAESRAIERMDAVASVADGALAEVSELMGDAEAASVALASSGGLSDAESAAYQMEIDSARQSAERIMATTTFNGQKVFDERSIEYGGASVSLDNPMPGAGGEGAFRDAIERVGLLRGEIGAFQKHALGAQARSAAAAYANTAAAESMIRDTDYAAEISNLARENVLGAARRAMMALGNAGSGSLLLG